MVPQAPPVGDGGAADSACGSNDPPKGLTKGVLGFLLTEGTGWGAKRKKMKML